MNYLKTLATKIDIQLNGYKTPKKALKKLPDYKHLIGNPPWQSKKKQ